jgi:hypothetical protein
MRRFRLHWVGSTHKQHCAIAFAIVLACVNLILFQTHSPMCFLCLVGRIVHHLRPVMQPEHIAASQCSSTKLGIALRAVNVHWDHSPCQLEAVLRAEGSVARPSTASALPVMVWGAKEAESMPAAALQLASWMHDNDILMLNVSSEGEPLGGPGVSQRALWWGA